MDAAGMEWFGFRLPSLRVECHHHYKRIAEGTFEVGVHGHDHWEVSRLTRGGADFSVHVDGGNVEFEHGPDRFLLIPPRIAHRWKATRTPILLNSWQVRLEPEDDVGERLLRSLTEVAVRNSFMVPAAPFQIEAEDLLWNLASRNLPPSLFAPMASGVARIVIGGVLAAVDPWPRELCEREQNQTNASEQLAGKIRDFLEANLHNAITMVDLESHFHYSSRQMNRIFQSHFRCSMSQFLRERRFDLATRWLATTNRSVKDIAFSLGFGTVSHFCRYFRRLKSLSPTEYRELANTGTRTSFVENTQTRDAAPASGSPATWTKKRRPERVRAPSGSIVR